MGKEKITVNIDPDLEDLIPGFLSNRKEDIEKLRTAIKSSSLDDLRSIGHSLKGVGGGYGFQKITEIGAEIENYAKSSNLDEIKKLIEDLDEYLDCVEIIYQE